MGNLVGRNDLMREVDNSAAALTDKAARNDLQGLAMQLREDMRTKDRDALMAEFGELQKATENSPTHLVMRQIYDQVGAPIGKDITLVSQGVDMDQRPVDLSIPIGQLYGERGLPYREPIAIRQDCAFEVTCRPNDGWYRRDDGVMIFGGRFPDGQIHLDFGKIDVSIGIGGGREHTYFEGGRGSHTVVRREEIVNRSTTIINNINNEKIVNVENRGNDHKNSDRPAPPTASRHDRHDHDDQTEHKNKR